MHIHERWSEPHRVRLNTMWLVLLSTTPDLLYVFPRHYEIGHFQYAQALAERYGIGVDKSSQACHNVHRSLAARLGAMRNCGGSRRTERKVTGGFFAEQKGSRKQRQTRPNSAPISLRLLDSPHFQLIVSSQLPYAI
jgi:hypothetical protein